MQTFNDRHAREILEPCGIDRYITIDERGVWPKVEHDATDGTNLFRWRTARVFQGEPGAPEVADTPMLPLPFTARDLAAFMLEGVGALAAGFYGDYANGPDPASLNAIDPDSNARTAIVQAYAARREAEQIVEAYPLELEAKADRARKAYNKANSEANIREGVSDSIPGTNDSSDRRARAVASIAELEKQYDRATKAYQKEQEKWMNLMVRELLKPAPAQTAPAPVVTASDVKQWLLPDPNDPPIVPPKDQPWYTPARYFARQLVISDSTLLIKKLVLADKVSKSLAGAGIFKRGGKKPHSPETVLKAFANVTLG